MECTFSVSRRPFKSGLSTIILRSNRPGRSNALSSTSGRFVAARTKSPFEVSNPSISASSWFKVCSRSSFPPPNLLSRLLPMASISSINMIHGACFWASLNKSLTRDAPTPTNISTKSEPASEKNGTFASPATALASSVLPVPGGPTSNAPFGSFAPISRYFFGLCRKSTTSCKDSFASSCPATSLKVTPVVFSPYTLALLLPTPIIPPPAFFMTAPKIIQIIIKGNTILKILNTHVDVLFGIYPSISTLCLFKRSNKFSSLINPV